MKEVRKETMFSLKEGEMVEVCRGGSRIPCVVKKCGGIPCRSCVLWKHGPSDGPSECVQWNCLVVDHSLYRSAASFIPIEEVVE